jgi:hypothetical protein
MPTRDDLIADWRKRLAEANESAADLTPRAAWLIRLRARLYRFLISLYDRGDWNAPQQTDEPGTNSFAETTNSTMPVDSPFIGKAAKSTDVIRHALTSIAGAQDRSRDTGSLTGDLLNDGWIVIASASAHVRTDRLVELFHLAGMACRVSSRGNDRLVEVRGRDRHLAFSILSENAAALRGREKRGQYDGFNFLLGLYAVAVLYAPLASLFFLWPILKAMDYGEITGPTARALTGLFFLGWAVCIIFYCAYGAWRNLRSSH